MRKTVTLFVILLLLIVNTRATAQSDRIQPWGQNPHYWQYQGKPLLLLGGTKTDHIFLLDGLKEHLDLLASVGGNYVRCTMSQREATNLKPYLLREDGKFDLDKWNPEYWKRFVDCLRWCRERNIIIQIEVWDRFDYSQENWDTSPWNPSINVNYTHQETGLAKAYPAPAYRDLHPFFYTVPGTPHYKNTYDPLRNRQEKFVEKMLSYSLDYPNVLYCMNNETSSPPAWGRYWMGLIKEKAHEKGVTVCTTDMFDDGWNPTKSTKLRQAFDDPQAYDFIDISQVNSRAFNEDHWRNITWVREQMNKHPRPLNNTKIYGDGKTTWGSGEPKDGIERFWRDVLAGCASVRFHRDGAGLGLQPIAQSAIRAMRKLESRIPLWTLSPRNDLLAERQEDEAYLATQTGRSYALYFTDGGAVTLNMKQVSGDFKLEWINIATGEWGTKQTIQAGKAITVKAPGKGGWAAAITKKN